MIAVGLVSLGCAKNLVDSEVMLGLLRRHGYEVTRRAERADVIVVNTCGFLESAREESYEAIRELADLKRRGRCRRLVVAGCLVQRRAAEMQADLPEVDQFLALNDVERILEACDPEAAPFDPDRSEATYLPGDGTPRILSSPDPSAYVKIAEGCDNPCSFCVIPRIRGRFRSRSVESLVAEAHALAEAGVREINLIAQDSTSYGIDRGGGPALPGLLRELAEVEGIRWIRLLYAYPNRVSGELVEMLGGGSSILPYLDLPLQHASGSVLARMRRGGSRDAFVRMIDDLRRRVPDLSLRTTFIVGFPGETEAEFDELRSFTEEIEFDHVGLFTYSHETGALSSALEDDVPAELKRERLQLLQDLQEGISARRYRRRVGSDLEVLVEGRGPERGTWTGRTAFQAPEVDGNVQFRASVAPGAFVRVTVEEALPYTLLGRVTGPGTDGRIRRGWAAAHSSSPPRAHPSAG